MADLYTTLTPRLVVSSAEDALAYYGAVFNAVTQMMIRDPQGNVVHAEFDIEGLRLSLTESDGDSARDPLQLGGTATIMMYHCDDPDAVAARATAEGGIMIFEVADRPYGMRDGRFQDPFGHQWMVTKTLEHLSEEELHDRVADM